MSGSSETVIYTTTLNCWMLLAVKPQITGGKKRRSFLAMLSAAQVNFPC
jgi:hypothetical protein